MAVGFETTAPTIGLSVLSAKKKKLKNLSFFTALKLIPPAMNYLVHDPRLKIRGFLCPGHVSSIIGTKPYEFIPAKFRIGCCVAGFEPVDILEAIFLLLQQIVKKKPKVENQYIRVVTKLGNLVAQKIIQEVFHTTKASWRGLGLIPKSGLKISDRLSQFDAEKVFSIKPVTSDERPATRCKCADVLKGLIRPDDCILFRKSCTPEHPLGPCMVSTEGACNVYYKYH